MDREEMNKIAEEQNSTFIKISRVPLETKELFLEISNESFCGDYGMCMKVMLDQFIEYQRVKEVLLDKEFLTYILENKNKEEKKIEEVPEKPKRRTFADMRKVKGGNEING
jgi:hypothetical protein